MPTLIVIGLMLFSIFAMASDNFRENNHFLGVLLVAWGMLLIYHILKALTTNNRK